MAWQYSIGNLAQRAANDPTAVAPAVSDTILPLANLASGYPDEEGSFTWRADGNYAVAVDLNLLANTSSRSDAPTGWRDLLLDYAGTPGLGSFPPDWGTHATRTALRLYEPLFQDIEVMPGENTAVSCGIYRDGAGTATSIQIRVTNTTTGLSWQGTNNAWEDGGVVEAQATANTWEDITETIVADANFTQRGTYRVIVEPVAPAYDANSYVYISGNAGSGLPAFYGEVDFVAMIGHNIPEEATVTVGNFTFATIESPSAYVSDTAEITQSWTLTLVCGANTPRPRIGELWFGRLTTLTRGVDPDIDVTEGDIAQIRVQGAGGRQEVVSDLKFPVSYSRLKVRTFTDAQHIQYRNEITRGTRFGADPIVVVPPDELQGSGRLIHARVGAVVQTKHRDQTWREFDVDLMESPMARA